MLCRYYCWSRPCLSIFVLVFYVVLVSSYRLCCLPFPSCSMLEFFYGWQILIDEHLNLESHINKICSTAFMHLRNINSIRKMLTDAAAAQVVHSLIKSRLDSCNAILYGLPQTLIKKLQRVQNAAARVVTRSRKYDHITPILQRLHWLPIEERIKYKIVLLTLKCLHNTAPEYLKGLLVP